MTQETIRVRHEDYSDSGRFLGTVEGRPGEAELTWHLGQPGVIVANHTYTPPNMRGTGISLALVRQLIAEARRRQVLIVPACSYVRAQFDRHPDWADLRAEI